MKIVKSCSEIRALILDLKKEGKEISFVPTMGFLHEGHLGLIKKAKESVDIVVVSIFVNKKQFNNVDDFKNYPIDTDRDIEKLQKESVDILFLPDDAQIYPAGEGELEFYPDPELVNILCGKSRQGHFQGVCKVLMKLFDLIQPDFVIFGLKDFQQFLVVKKMIEFFKLDIEIVGVEIIRENSGLAMSSRNHNLSALNREKAVIINQIMLKVENDIKKTGNITLTLQNSIRELEKNDEFVVDYFEVRRESDLSIVDSYDELIVCRLFAAIYVGQVRLIDNLKI